MSKKNININKFLTGAITATMVASAVAPVAALAADESTSKFTDISGYAQDTQDKINALVDAGIVNGTSETTFSPSVAIKRGQVVKLLGRYLVEAGIAEIPADWDSEQRFSDVPVDFKDADLVKNAAVVFDAGVFQGSNGVLNTAGEISRQNMALVLDRAAEAIIGYSLVELADGEESDVADLADAKAEARPAIEALNILGISTVENFKPTNNVSRANFATFLYNAIEVIEAVEFEDGVETVTAINQTIANGKSQELVFDVNGEKYTATTFDEMFGEEGYTVEFFYNKSSNGDTFGEDGTVTVADAGSFKYSVQVTDAEGVKIPTDATNAANFAKVEVKSDAIETVTEAKLSNDLTYVTLNNKDVTFVATKGIDGLGKVMLPADGEDTLTDVTFERAVSSDSTVAFVEDKKIVPVKVGVVTFDVYFTNVEEPVKVKVEIKEAQEATSMASIENLKVQTGEVTLPKVTVLDQYGEEMTATPKIKVTNKDNVEVKVNNGKVSLTEAGLYTVTVFASGDQDAKKLGSYTIETVKVDENTTPDAYELNFDKGDKDVVLNTLDIEEGDDVKIDVVGKVDGVQVATKNFHKNLEAKTNDVAVKATYADGVITVALADGQTPKEGNVTITLFYKEGSMVQNLQTATVKVVNTAAQITELTLVDEEATALTAQVADAEALTAANEQNYFTAEDIEDQLSAGKNADDEEIFKKEMVKEVKFIERVMDADAGTLTGKVQVILDAKYGGQTFVFDAVISTEEVESEITFTEAVEEIAIATTETTVASATNHKVVVTVGQVNADATITLA